MLDQAAGGSTRSTENFTIKRRYLTEREVEQVMDTARKIGRHGHRDATMLLVAYRHGLRASEVCGLEWHQIELDQGRLHVRRAKRGTPSVHPIRGDESVLCASYAVKTPTKPTYSLASAADNRPMGFHHLIQRLSKAARMPFAVDPHDAPFRLLSRVWLAVRVVTVR